MPQDKNQKAYRKSLPHIDEESRPWWEAAQRHELYMQKCRDCGDLRFHPRTLCTNCMASSILMPIDLIWVYFRGMQFL